MALHCYKEALETDPQCVCALYQSILVYRTLGNLQAELQALRLLHSVSETGQRCSRYTEKTLFQPIRKGDPTFVAQMMLSTAEASPADAPLLSPSSLLPSRSLKSLLSVPSALSLLHCLAQKCVLQGRWEDRCGSLRFSCLLQLV